ncbi:hypothetical protein Tco_1267056 [Tanacetum coccineum]
MEKLSFDLNVRKESSDSNEAAQYGGNPKSFLFEIHNGGCFTITRNRLNVLPFLRPRLGLDYGLNSLTVDADVLELAKYAKDNKIILVYVEHGSTNVDSSIFVTPKNGVGIAVDNYLRKDPIEIDSSPDVNRNLTPICHRNLTKEWEEVSFNKALSIGEVLKNLSNKQHVCSDKGPIIVETDDPFDDLDEILRGVGPMGNFKEVEVDADNEKSSESDLEENDTNGSDSEDLDYDPKHDEVFDDDEHILEDVPVSMNNFNFNPDPKHDISIVVVEVYEHDLDVIDYDSFDSDLDDGIDSERRIQLKELRRICKAKNQGPNTYYFYLGQQFATK